MAADVSSCLLLFSSTRVVVSVVLLLFCINGSSVTVAKKPCTKSWDCGFGWWICCHGTCEYGKSCPNNCKEDSDCSLFPRERCCSGSYTRSKDCSDEKCSFDYDCSENEECCFGSCHYRGDCSSIITVIISSVVGGIVLICLLSFCVCWIRRCQRRTSTVTVQEGQSQCAPTSSRSNPEYEHPPPYQSTWNRPQFSCPQNSGLQNYSSAYRMPVEPPPAYDTVQRETGQTYAPQRSYGAILPEPSAPPLYS